MADTPRGMAAGPDCDLYLAQNLSSNVNEYDGVDGSFVGVFVGFMDGGLQNPMGVAFGPDNDLYVTSRGTDNVLRYDGTTGAFIDAVFPSGSGGLDEPYFLEINDILSHLNFLFLGTFNPRCMDATDSNDDGESDISDSILSA
jgi:hypothetical protein